MNFYVEDKSYPEYPPLGLDSTATSLQVVPTIGRNGYWCREKFDNAGMEIMTSGVTAVVSGFKIKDGSL